MIVSSGVFAFTKQEEDKMKNFIEGNLAEADRLTVSDVQKALPFMSELEATEFLLNMKKFLARKNMR